MGIGDYPGAPQPRKVFQGWGSHAKRDHKQNMTNLSCCLTIPVIHFIFILLSLFYIHNMSRLYTEEEQDIANTILYNTLQENPNWRAIANKFDVNYWRILA